MSEINLASSSSMIIKSNLFRGRAQLKKYKVRWAEIENVKQNIKHLKVTHYHLKVEFIISPQLQAKETWKKIQDFFKEVRQMP